MGKMIHANTAIILFVLLTAQLTAIFVAETSGGNDFVLGTENAALDIDDRFDTSDRFSFTENRGQWDPGVNFIARTAFGHIGFGNDRIYFNFVEVTGSYNEEMPVNIDGYVFKYIFLDANDVEPQGTGRLNHQTNFILGSDPSKWVSGAASYEAVIYDDLWDGIDLIYFSTGDGPKYEFVLQPGADPSSIRIRVEGHTSLQLMGRDLEIELENGMQILDRDLSVFYRADRSVINADFDIIDDRTYSFALGDYDRTETIIIDPLIYSTFISGSDWEHGRGVAYDSGGNAYVTGQTLSTDFPTTTGAYDETQNGLQDAYVTKLNPSGSSRIYTTYIGGTMDEWGYGITVDSNNNAYITGCTKSSDFPTTPGAYDESYSLDWDAFIFKLNASGTGPVYSTFVGSSGRDIAYRIEIDSGNNAYITGRTESTGFPTTSGAYDEVHNGGEDVFVTKLSAAGNQILKSTFVGGALDERGNDLALDSSNNVYVTGFSVFTSSNEFPTTTGAYDEVQNGGEDAVVFKLNASFSDLLYSTFIGGSGDDRGSGIEVDAGGNAYIAGRTKSANFPMSSGAYDSTYKGTEMAFSLKLDPSGKTLKYSTYLGGSGNDYALDLAVDAGGQAFVTGSTTSTNFPTTGDGENQTHCGGILDLYLTEVAANGKSILYSTFRGGSSADYGYAVRIDTFGTLYLAGTSSSSDFPTTPGAAQASRKGNDEAVCVKFSFKPPFPSPTDLQAQLGKGFIRLTWNDVAGAIGLLGYKVFRGESSGDHSLIDTPGNVTEYNDTSISNDRAYYYIVTAFNGTSESYASNEVCVKDDILPALGPDGTPAYATTGDELTFSIDVKDKFDVKSVFVEYWYSGSAHTNLSMSFSSGSTWIRTIVVNHSLDDLYYKFSANDSYDNWNVIQTNIEVRDNDLPVFVDDGTPPAASTGENFTFLTEIQDNIGVYGAWVEYWFGTAGHANSTMFWAGGGLWTLSMIIPSDSTEKLFYKFYTNDTSGNWNKTQAKEIIVSDKTKPYILDDFTEDFATTGDPFEFILIVSDNIDVFSAWTEYWYGTSEKKNISMTEGMGNKWKSVIGISDSLDELNYVFHVNDTSGNWNETKPKSIGVSDNDEPEVNDSTPAHATTGDEFTFTVDLTDNIGIGGVDIEFWYGEESHGFITLRGDPPYTRTIVIPPDIIEPLHYIIHGFDTSDNKNISDVKDVVITDNDPPGFGKDLMPESTTTGASITFSLLVGDNIEVENVTVNYRFGQGSISMVLELENTGYEYDGSIKVPENSTDSVYYTVTAFDTSGNYNTTLVKEIEVKDNIAPTIKSISDLEIRAGEAVDITLEPADNIGIKEIKWKGSPIDATGEKLEGKVMKAGIYEIEIVVIDDAGNSVSTTFTLTVTEADDDGKDSIFGSGARAILIAMALIIVIIVVVLVIIIKRKKTEEDEASPAAPPLPPVSSEPGPAEGYLQPGMDMGGSPEQMYDQQVTGTIPEITPEYQPESPGFEQAYSLPSTEVLTEDLSQSPGSDQELSEGPIQSDQVSMPENIELTEATEQPAETAVPEAVRCQYCGNVVTPGSMNCTICGQQL